jgi:hypothetical protein
VAGVPHLAYHATTTGKYSTGDNAASLTGLALDVLLPLAVLYLVSDHAQGRASGGDSARRETPPEQPARERTLQSR